ncbi:MAG: hypothetical protein KGL74_01875 [Elusimicrobia bacterium]|nr:hypothetical protein [Elusimicrobiota bacterium]
MSVMLLGLVCLGLWSARSGTPAEPGVELTDKLDQLTAAWAANDVPAGDRAVVLVLSDAETSGDPLELADAPSILDRLRGWFRRRILGRSAIAGYSRFSRAFDADATTISWTQANFPSADDENQIRALMAVVVKAHDAGAELDIVAQGLSAGPALLALQRLDGTVRQGQKVGVNKLVTIGMNSKTLKKLDRAFQFGKPGNLREWAAICRTDSFQRGTEIGVLDAEKEYARYSAEDLFPEWNGRLDGLAPLVRHMIVSPNAFRQQLDQRARPAPAPALDASASGPLPTTPDSGPKDSLALIAGGAGLRIPDSAPAAKPQSMGKPQRAARMDVRLTRAKMSGYDISNEACLAEFPRTSANDSWICRLGNHEKEPPLDQYPSDWAWVDDTEGLGVCATGVPSERIPGRQGTIAYRGKKRLESCTEFHPIACCVYTSSRRQ